MEFKKFPFALTLIPLPSLYKVDGEKKNTSVRIKTSSILIYLGSVCPTAALTNLLVRGCRVIFI